MLEFWHMLFLTYVPRQARSHAADGGSHAVPVKDHIDGPPRFGPCLVLNLGARRKTLLQHCSALSHFLFVFGKNYPNFD
jgi:hypothetical protein